MNVLKYKNKIQKILIAFFILQLFILLVINFPVKAGCDGILLSGGGQGFLQSIFQQGNQFTQMGQSGGNSTGINSNSVWTPLLEITKALTIVGFGFVIIRMLILIPSIRCDSPDEQKKAKQKMTQFIILAIVLAASYKIWSFALNVLGNVTNSGVNVNSITNSMNSSTVPISNIPPLFGNILNLLISVVQVGVTGYFVIRFTYEGIRYFSLTVASEQAASKKRLMWYLMWGAMAFGASSIVRIIYNIFA